jgi:hypothetical protein
MKITVTAEDIKNGKPDMPEFCPIALAVKRAGLCEHPYVISTYIDCEDGTFYDLPHNASEFITMFDAHKTVQPFEFDIEVPSSPE